MHLATKAINAQALVPSLWSSQMINHLRQSLLFRRLLDAARWGPEICVLTRAAALDELQQLVDESPHDQLIDILRDAIEMDYSTLNPREMVGTNIETDNELLQRLRNLRERQKKHAA